MTVQAKRLQSGRPPLSATSMTPVLFKLVLILVTLTALVIFLSGGLEGPDSHMAALIAVFPVLVVAVPLRKSSAQVFHFVLLLFGFIRYVLLPVLISHNSGYSGRSLVPPQSESLVDAVYLMVFELLAVALVIVLVNRFWRFEPSRGSTPVLSRTYLKVAVLSFGALLLVTPAALDQVSFLRPKQFTDAVSLGGGVSLLIAGVFVVSKQALVVNYLHKTAGKRWAQQAALLLIGINTAIFLGKSRIDILTTAVASCVIYLRLRGSSGAGQRTSKLLGSAVAGLVLVLLVLVSESRATVFVGDTLSERVADTAQVYTGGVYNVALGLETAQWFPESRDLVVLASDLGRPLVGIEALVDFPEDRYSNVYFNDRMWTHVDRRSQIMPMVGQGGLYLGFLAPAWTAMFVFAFYWLLRTAARVRSLEIDYLVVVISVRFGMVFGQNSMNIINELSINLVLFAVVAAPGLVFFPKKIVTTEDMSR